MHPHQDSNLGPWKCSIKYDHSKFFASQPINIIPRYYTQIAKSVLMVAPHAIISTDGQTCNLY